MEQPSFIGEEKAGPRQSETGCAQTQSGYCEGVGAGLQIGQFRGIFGLVKVRVCP
jgi:hypothetical protein